MIETSLFPGPSRFAVASSTNLTSVLTVSAAPFGGGPADNGTRVVDRVDLGPLITGTSLRTFDVEGPVAPFAAPTRMARIRALAPLSFREWAPVFGVSHSAIKQWADGDEPGREKLDRVLGALDAAAAHQPDLGRWLMTPLPGMQQRPIDLLREDHWRAFRGALRVRAAPPASVAPEELARRREMQISWAVAEPATLAEEA